jgi:hypothetical protein
LRFGKRSLENIAFSDKLEVEVSYVTAGEIPEVTVGRDLTLKQHAIEVRQRAKKQVICVDAIPVQKQLLRYLEGKERKSAVRLVLSGTFEKYRIIEDEKLAEKGDGRIHIPIDLFINGHTLILLT